MDRVDDMSDELKNSKIIIKGGNFDILSVGTAGWRLHRLIIII